jgi:thymidylate kinase
VDEQDRDVEPFERELHDFFSEVRKTYKRLANLAA